MLIITSGYTLTDFGQPNVETGRKMANGQLLFLALLADHSLNQFYKPLECYIITSSCALGDYVTFLEFLKQRRTLDLNNHVYLYNKISMPINRFYASPNYNLYLLPICYNKHDNSGQQ